MCTGSILLALQTNCQNTTQLSRERSAFADLAKRLKAAAEGGSYEDGLSSDDAEISDMDVMDPPSAAAAASASAAAAAATSSAHAPAPRRSQRHAAPASATGHSKAESVSKEKEEEDDDSQHVEEGEEEEDVDIMNSPLQRPWGAQVGSIMITNNIIDAYRSDNNKSITDTWQ